MTDSFDFYRAALETGGMGAWETNMADGTRIWSPEGARIFNLDVPVGVPLRIDEHDHLAALVHPEDYHLFSAARDKLGSSDIVEANYRVLLPDGTVKHLAGHGRVLSRDKDGLATRVVHIVSDVTRLRQNEAHLELLMGELRHRLKNQLAVIGVLARQSSNKSQSMPDFQETFSSRLLALGRAIDALVDQDWRSVGLLSLVRDHVRSMVGAGSDRVQYNGPDVEVSPKVAEALSLALHELSTNAIKYGALSAKHGNVEVTWEIQTIEGNDHLSMWWKEKGGPSVSIPEQTGFGTVLMQKMLSSVVGTTVSIEYRPDGVIWSFQAPLSALK